MEIKYNILDKKRKEVFKKFTQFSRYGYLAGGTAIALQIGHRISYDFDFFCLKPISISLVKKIRENFSIKNVAINSGDELTFFDKNGIKITFLYYPFKFRGKLIVAEGVKLLSAENIALAKMYALNRRASYRDYVDLFFIFKKYCPNLPALIKKARRVYGELFSEKLFLAQLAYLEDIPREETKGIVFLGEKYTYEEIKKFFLEIVGGYKKKLR